MISWTMQRRDERSIDARRRHRLLARILQDQLNVFVNFEEPRREETAPSIPELAFNPALLKKVDELELSVRSANCLKNDNIGLYRRSDSEIGGRDAADPRISAANP